MLMATTTRNCGDKLCQDVTFAALSGAIKRRFYVKLSRLNL